MEGRKVGEKKDASEGEISFAAIWEEIEGRIVEQEQKWTPLCGEDKSIQTW